jgi:hypothetical protein
MDGGAPSVATRHRDGEQEREGIRPRRASPLDPSLTLPSPSSFLLSPFPFRSIGRRGRRRTSVNCVATGAHPLLRRVQAVHRRRLHRLRAAEQVGLPRAAPSPVSPRRDPPWSPTTTGDHRPSPALPFTQGASLRPHGEHRAFFPCLLLHP